MALGRYQRLKPQPLVGFGLVVDASACSVKATRAGTQSAFDAPQFADDW